MIVIKDTMLLYGGIDIMLSNPRSTFPIPDVRKTELFFGKLNSGYQISPLKWRLSRLFQNLTENVEKSTNV
jgi:hypothetical protein